MFTFGDHVYYEGQPEVECLVLSVVDEEVTIVDAEGNISKPNGSFVHSWADLLKAKIYELQRELKGLGENV